MVAWSKSMSPSEKYEYRKEHRSPKRKQELPVDMGSAIVRMKREGKSIHNYGNSIVPLEGGAEVYLHPRAGLVIRRKGRAGPRITSHVAEALKECAGNPDFIGCVTAKVPTFKPYSWRRHEELMGKA